MIWNLQEWLEKYIFPAEAKNVDREFVRWGTRLAVLEMALSGTTTYTDMYYFEETVAEETKAAGMRGVLGETIIGFPAPDYKTIPERAGRYRGVSAESHANDPLIVPRSRRIPSLATNTDEIAGRHPPLGGSISEASCHSPLGNQEGERRRLGAAEENAHGGAGGARGAEWVDGVAAHGVWLDDSDLTRR